MATWSGGDSPSGNQRTQVQVFPNIPDDLSYIWDSSLYMKLNLKCQDMVSMKFQRKGLTLWKTIKISGLLKFLTHLENMKGLTVDFQMVFLWWELLSSYGFHWKWTGLLPLIFNLEKRASIGPFIDLNGNFSSLPHSRLVSDTSWGI